MGFSRTVGWFCVGALLAACGRLGYAPPDDGLVLHFAFDEDASATGIMTDDHDARLVARCASSSCPSLVTGVLDGAGAFDGADALVLDATPLLQTTAAFTATAWVTVDALGTTQTIASKPYDPVGSDVNTWGLFIWADGSVGFETFEPAPVGGNMLDSPPGAVGVGRWTHLAAVWGGSEKRLYVDGVLVDATVVETVFDDSEVRIGSELDFGETVLPLTGAVDEVRVYERALDDDEIDALAAR